jgi:hypothetical protein
MSSDVVRMPKHVGTKKKVQSSKRAEWVRECKRSDCGILLEYDFSSLTGQQQAFYPKNKWINKS